MEKVENVTVPKKRVKKTGAPVVLDGSGPRKRPLLKQGTTWAGILSIAAAVATGGTSILADPTALGAIGAGIALIFAEN